jgi:outer membrane protein
VVRAGYSELVEEEVGLFFVDIKAKRAEAKALQKERFGPEGELFRKRKELIQPIQDKIFEELMAIAESGGYSDPEHEQKARYSSSPGL